MLMAWGEQWGSGWKGGHNVGGARWGSVGQKEICGFHGRIYGAEGIYGQSKSMGQRGICGVQSGVCGVQKRIYGVQIGSMGLRAGSMGLREGSVGFREGSMGFREGSVGFRAGSVGFRAGSVGQPHTYPLSSSSRRWQQWFSEGRCDPRCGAGAQNAVGWQRQRFGGSDAWGGVRKSSMGCYGAALWGGSANAWGAAMSGGGR